MASTTEWVEVSVEELELGRPRRLVYSAGSRAGEWRTVAPVRYQGDKYVLARHPDQPTSAPCMRYLKSCIAQAQVERAIPAKPEAPPHLHVVVVAVVVVFDCLRCYYYCCCCCILRRTGMYGQVGAVLAHPTEPGAWELTYEWQGAHTKSLCEVTRVWPTAVDFVFHETWGATCRTVGTEKIYAALKAAKPWLLQSVFFLSPTHL